MTLWRFIDTGPGGAAYNMALDEAIAITVRSDGAPPTLRLYGWDTPSVSIGCFQTVKDINVPYCHKENIPLVRRLTGGRAVFHDDELTYGFSAKTTSDLFLKGLLDSYKKISMAFARALSRIGISPELKLPRNPYGSPSSDRLPKSPSCFHSVSYGEITVNGRKIMGSAQKRWAEGLLQQGSIPFIIDEDAAIKIFGLHSIHNIGLREIFPLPSINRIKDAIRISFEETFGVKFIFSSPSKEEISLARELETRKYLSHEWNFKR